MLNIKLKKNEYLCIGDEILICVSEIRGKAVRIGVEAPKNKKILRHNLLLQELQNAGFIADGKDLNGFSLWKLCTGSSMRIIDALKYLKGLL